MARVKRDLRGQKPPHFRRDEYTAVQIAKSVREYLLVMLEEKRERQRCIPLACGWLLEAVGREGGTALKAAMRAAVQCWHIERAAIGTPGHLGMESDTDLAFDVLFLSAGLHALFYGARVQALGEQITGTD